MQPYGLVVLRLAIGLIFVAHGAQKLFGVWGGGGIEGTAAYFAQLGLAPAMPLAVTVAVAEFTGGLLLVAGAFTIPAALALSAIMLGAMWKVHFAHGFFLTSAGAAGTGYEFNLALLAALVCLVLSGPGAFSLDERRERSAEAMAAGRARIRAGRV